MFQFYCVSLAGLCQLMMGIVEDTLSCVRVGMRQPVLAMPCAPPMKEEQACVIYVQFITCFVAPQRRNDSFLPAIKHPWLSALLL